MSIFSQKLKKLPVKSGVYFFLGSRGRILYIGKAGSLRDRVRSYFSKDIQEARGAGIAKMIEEVRDITWEVTDSVLEALILEAKLIKKHKPKYNVRERDDKSFNYVVITDEDFPRVLTMRERNLNHKSKIINLKSIFGPFPQGGQLREALGIVRKIFPFRDKCTPAPAPHKKHTDKLENVGVSGVGDIKKGAGKQKGEIGRMCFNRQIGLCPGVCTGEISKKEYAKQIQNIRLLFLGKKKRLLGKLKQEMKSAAKHEDFERAAETRNAIFALNHIQDIALLKHEIGGGTLARETVDKPQKGRTFLGVIHRIEGYDVAHLHGKDTVGVMVVLEDSEPKRQDYRKFKIRESKTGGDVPALKEILERRLGHPEWPLPRFIVVDGGKAQMNAATRVLLKYGIQIPVVGVVKDEHHRPKKILGDASLISNHEKEILLVNAEAHRFAIGFHRARRGARMR